MKRLFIAALLGLAACSNTPPSVGEAGPTLDNPQAEQAYVSVLDRYTDVGEVYDGFDTRFFAGATFQTPAFREARVRRQAAFQLLPEARVQAMLADEMAEAAKFHDVFLSIHFNDTRYDDLSQKHSIWRVALVTPTGEVTPLEIRRLGRSNLDVRAYYPYAGVFWIGYRLRFPQAFSNGQPVIPDAADRVALRLSSSLGQVELKLGAH